MNDDREMAPTRPRPVAVDVALIVLFLAVSAAAAASIAGTRGVACWALGAINTWFAVSAWRRLSD